MMFLSSQEILEEIASGAISFSPAVAAGDIRPFGVRLHLASDFLRPQGGVVNVDGSSGDPAFERVDIDPGDTVRIQPREFLLGSTSELIRLDSSIAGFLDGRSTLARLGLFVHAGSQIIDGTALTGRTITLELFNAGPHELVLRPGVAIGMLSFFRSSSASDVGLIHSQYDGQAGTTPPRLGPT